MSEKGWLHKLLFGDPPDRGRGVLIEVLLVLLFFTPIGTIWFLWWLVVDMIGKPIIAKMRV